VYVCPELQQALEQVQAFRYTSLTACKQNALADNLLRAFKPDGLLQEQALSKCIHFLFYSLLLKSMTHQEIA